MKRILIGNYQGGFVFRSSIEGVNAGTLVNGDKAILHEDQQPVPAAFKGTWASSGNDNTTISLPAISEIPFNVLMNPDDGSAMLPYNYQATWNIGSKQLTLYNYMGAKTFRWVVLVDL